MEEQLISFETAKLAKEKGFDITQKILTIYDIDTKDESYKEEEGITQSLLQKWLREKHDIDISVIYWDKGYLYSVQKRPHKGNHYSVEYINTYEEALEKGLYESLKLI